MDTFGHVGQQPPRVQNSSMSAASKQLLDNTLNRHIADKSRAHEAAQRAYRNVAYNQAGHAQAHHEVFRTGQALVDAKLAQHHINHLQAQNPGDAKAHGEMVRALKNTLARDEAAQREEKKTPQMAVGHTMKAAMIARQRLLLNHIDDANDALSRHTIARGRSAVLGEVPGAQLRNLKQHYANTREALDEELGHYQNNLTRL